MKKTMSQLTFDFVLVMDRELAEKRELERIERKKRIHDSWLHSNVENLPPAPEEWDIILMGIRLCRHVHPNECEGCKLATHNHCPDWMGGYIDEYGHLCLLKVCLKDYFRWCRQNNLKYLIRKQLRL